MAINFTEQVRDKSRVENPATNTEASRPASQPPASGIAIRSLSERQPAPPLLCNAAANQRNSIAAGSPGNRKMGQASGSLSDASRPHSPLSAKLIRKIERLTGDEEEKSKRSLLRLHGSDTGHVDDMLAPLKINWLVSVDDSVASGELSRATPPPGCTLSAEGKCVFPVLEVPQLPPRRELTPTEAFFTYPGPGANNLGYAQWMQSHPLHRMFRQVYPLHEAISSLGQPVETPMHALLRGGIWKPLSLYHTLMVLVEDAASEGRSSAFETLFRNAVAVSRQADGLLKKQADFFSRFFSVLIALGNQVGNADNERLIETLRQEWLETDFNVLSGHVETHAPQAYWQAAEPARMQASGRRSLADALGQGDMSPRKRQKTGHDRDASTADSKGQAAFALQAPGSPCQDGLRTPDADDNAERSPPLEGKRTPVGLRNLSWNTPPLKRKPRMAELPFKAWVASASAREAGASPATARPPSGQLASGALASGAAITPADPHGNQLSN